MLMMASPVIYWAYKSIDPFTPVQVSKLPPPPAPSSSSDDA